MQITEAPLLSTHDRKFWIVREDGHEGLVTLSDDGKHLKTFGKGTLRDYELQKAERRILGAPCLPIECHADALTKVATNGATIYQTRQTH